MKKRNASHTRLLSLCLSLIMILAGCADAGATGLQAADTLPSATGQNGNAAAVVSLEGFTTEYAYAQEDTDAEWKADNATSVVFDGSTAQVSGAGAAFAGDTLTISEAGTYVLSGQLGNGQILIDAGKKDLERLVLNGVSLRHESGPAMYAPQSGKVILILAEGTENFVSDGTGYSVTEGGDDPDAAIYVQDDLSITGSGTLTVTGAMKHGIRAQDILAISSGTLRVTAAGDALRGRDGVAIQGGNLTLIAEGDGIQSNNDNSDDMGFILIGGGTLSITAGNDGIQAESALTVTGGSFDIHTGGGSANAPVRTENSQGGWGGWWGGTSSETTEEETESMKAIKAGKLIHVAGGAFIIDAEDDAVHSNDALLVTAGTFTIQTGDDAFHADAALEICGGAIDVLSCYEGIEGLSVTIGGGVISVVASDDAMNAAGGTDSASQEGRPTGRDRFAVNGDIFLRISGGELDLYALHDGIDSNGNVFIEGGITKISGPSMGMEGALDFDGSLMVTGGSLITAGSVLSVSRESTQPVILVSYGYQIPADSVIAIKDAAGNTVLEYTGKTTFSQSGFTSPQFALGETYALYIGDEKLTDITLETVVTTLGGGSSATDERGGRGTGGGGGGRGR